MKNDDQFASPEEVNARLNERSMKNEKRYHYETLSFSALQAYCATYSYRPVRIVPGRGEEKISAEDVALSDLIQIHVLDGDPMAGYLETFEIVLEGGNADSRLA